MPEIAIVPHIPCIVPETHQPAVKHPGFARFIFLGRICKMKNLLFALRALSGINGAMLEIYGPVEDHRYWKECQDKIVLNNISTLHYGEVAYDRVLPTLQRGHFFILPTLGENFCHALFEALAAGCTPILSNKTSWHDLMEKESGWTLPLEHLDMWQRVISRCVEMDQEEYSACSLSSHRYAVEWFKRQDFAKQYSEMFSRAITSPHT
jgi:glycosyltransferase involved in cell wall biosynthesis